MLLETLVHASAAVAATSGRLDKTATLATLLKQAAPDEVPTIVGFLTGWPRQGKLGVGWAAVVAAREGAPATVATLELSDVENVFDRLLATRGKDSAREKGRVL